MKKQKEEKDGGKNNNKKWEGRGYAIVFCSSEDYKSNFPHFSLFPLPRLVYALFLLTSGSGRDPGGAAIVLLSMKLRRSNNSLRSWSKGMG